MSSKITYRIFTGPMDKDWLVAELLCGKEHFADLTEWGEMLILYPRSTKEALNFPLDELLEVLKSARDAVRLAPKDHE